MEGTSEQTALLFRRRGDTPPVHTTRLPGLPWIPSLYHFGTSISLTGIGWLNAAYVCSGCGAGCRQNEPDTVTGIQQTECGEARQESGKSVTVVAYVCVTGTRFRTFDRYPCDLIGQKASGPRGRGQWHRGMRASLRHGGMYAGLTILSTWRHGMAQGRGKGSCDLL